MLINETTFAQPQQMNPLTSSIAQKNIFVSHKGCYHKLEVADILWVSSEGNYAHIYTSDKHYFNRISLANLLKLLPAYMFKKIHKCHVVRLDAIENIDRTNSELVVAGNKIPIGRSYKADLLGQLNLIG